jgi:hypothetical protein
MRFITIFLMLSTALVASAKHKKPKPPCDHCDHEGQVLCGTKAAEQAGTRKVGIVCTAGCWTLKYVSVFARVCICLLMSLE